MWVSELKRGQCGSNHNQFYAEAFNVIITKCAQKFQYGTLKDLTTMSVFCILLTDGCKRGRLSQLTVDFSMEKCQVIVDKTVYTCEECLNIAFNQ